MTAAEKNRHLPGLHTHWMIRPNMPAVVEIERASFPPPCAWFEEDFADVLRQRNTIGFVAETSTRVVGFLIFEIMTDTLRLLNFAVHPGYRRMGVGAALIGLLIRQGEKHHRRLIDVLVRESNLQALTFFRAHGFLAVEVLRDYYAPVMPEDAIRLEYYL